MSGVASLAARYQIQQNGTVINYQIENEYPKQWEYHNEKIPNYSSIAYMEAREENARKNGVFVPLTHNSTSSDKLWSTD